MIFFTILTCIFTIIFHFMLTMKVTPIIIIVTFLSFVIFPVIIAIIIKIVPKKIRYNEKVNKNSEVIYNREPPFTYSPVIVSYLSNLKLEFKKDILAQLLYLKKIGALTILKHSNNYFIYRNNNFNLSNMLRVDMYLLKKIPYEQTELKDLIAKLELDKREIKYLYEKDCIELGYLKVIKIFKDFEPIYTIYFILIGIVGTKLIQPISGSIASIFGIFSVMSIISISVAAVIQKIQEKFFIYRTDKAKDEYSQWIAFVDFLKHYSKIQDYSLDSIVIWDLYLVYAVTFDISKIYKDI